MQFINLILFVILVYFIVTHFQTILFFLILGIFIAVIYFIFHRMDKKKNPTYAEKEEKSYEKAIDQTASYSKKAITSFQKYSTIHKDKINGTDNMNYYSYIIKGINPSTKRKNTNYIEAFDEEEAKSIAASMGMEEPFEIELSKFSPPTENQIRCMKDHHNNIPSDACQYDMAELISSAIENDHTPNPGLIKYATMKKIKLSQYIGKKALYNLIWYKLQGIDKIAFFIFCVYRYESNDREANLECSPHKSTFYEFAKINIEDKSFMNSMNRYDGESLRYFGELTVGNATYTGGSTRTIAYKKAIEYLKNKNLI